MATERIKKINDCEYCYGNYAISMADEECLYCGNCGYYDIYGKLYAATE